MVEFRTSGHVKAGFISVIMIYYCALQRERDRRGGREGERERESKYM